jgi:hypothetical protein
MSEIKVNKLSPRTNCGTVQLGDSGDTITIPAGVTITNSGTAAGFGATGAVSWDTTAKTTGFTAVDGVGYFVNTTAGAITVTLPLSPAAGAVIGVSDYAGTADTNNITIGRNGSNINGAAADLTVANENSAVTLVYVDGTQGWKATDTSSLTDLELQPTYVTATGGTITCCGDYKIHTFTSPGTFCVSVTGNPIGGPSAVDYLVVAGGGGGGGSQSSGNAGGGSGGGAGGYRTSFPSPAGTISVTTTAYPITVGAGGTAGTGCSTEIGNNGGNGNQSIFSTIISAGGGGGRGGPCNSQNGQPGGSGGGASGGNPGCRTGGSGNTPPVSPSQGNNGGNTGPLSSPEGYYSAGGGGAGGVGGNAQQAAPLSPAPRAGGSGASNSISSSSITYAAGGLGGSYLGRACGVSGTTNTGNAGTGASGPGSPDSVGGAGGSGIVVIRYKFQN